MNTLNNRGVALVTALMLTTIALIIILAAFFMLSRGTETSALFKRYDTALEASKGGVDFFGNEFVPKAISGSAASSLGNYGGVLAYGITDACFANKLRLATANWGCGSSTMDPTATPDLTMTMTPTAGAPFQVRLKIVDTQPGNSDTSNIQLEGLGVVDPGSGTISPPHIPYVYRVEIRGDRTTGPADRERANLSVMYAF